MLRGTITLADRGAFLRACDRLGFPLFTVLNARPAARAAVWEATTPVRERRKLYRDA